jgi:hypothetical protein
VDSENTTDDWPTARGFQFEIHGAWN